MAQRASLPTGPFMDTGMLICTRGGSSPGSQASGAPAAAVRRAGPWRSRPFARRGCRGCLARRGSFGVLGDAAAQRLHEIDHPMRRGKGLLALLNGARLLGLEVRQQRLLVAVPEGCGVELAGLAVENVLGKLAHVRRNGEVRQVAEIILGLADLIGVAQRRSEQSLVIGLQRNHPLALRQHHPPKRYQPLSAYGLTNNRNGLLPDRLP